MEDYYKREKGMIPERMIETNRDDRRTWGVLQ